MLFGLTSVSLLSGLLIWGMFTGPQPVSAQGGCTVGGKQITSGDGQMLCDCTVTASQNCRCTLSSGDCPKKPAEEAELEMGAY